MDSSYCKQLDVHPLTQERDRFLYLINDIKNRKDDYAAQLSQLTLASYSQVDKRGDESKNEILSSLMGNDVQGESDKAEDNKEQLWKARLVLAIAQLLDQEEEELARSLAFLENSEMSIFRELKGEEGSPDLVHDLSDIQSKMSSPKAESVKNRIHSWFNFADDSTLPSMDIWSCSRPEVAAHLFEHHEKTESKAPEKILSLPIPVHIGKSTEEAMDAIALFHREKQEIIEKIHSLISNAQTDVDKDEMESLQTIWAETIDEHFPADTSLARLGSSAAPRRSHFWKSCLAYRAPEPSGTFALC